MKTYIFILSLILLHPYSFAQERKKAVMNIKRPKNVLKIDGSDNIFLKSRGLDDESISFFKDNIYQKDSLLNYYAFVHEIPLVRKPLKSRLKIMKSLIGTSTDSKLDSAFLMTYNNTNYFIIYYSRKNYKYIKYTSDYDRNGYFINGFIQYPEGYYKQAQQYFQEIIKSMKFVN